MQSRHLLLLLPLALAACHHTPRKHAGTLTTIKTGIQPSSITIDAVSGWAAAPIAQGTPLFTDNYYSVQFYPPSLQGAILIQRPEHVASAGIYLEGKVTVPTAATLYMALLCQNNDDRLVSDEELNALAGDGWTKNHGIFSTSQPDGQHWYWAVYSHPIPAGPVTLTSEAIEHPSAVFIIGKQR
jgi:hypothetical protein